ncbi:MAG: hypothetical protein HYX68_04365 [Planctomycetes bacterium]|nr:hypothetical protein [Planctomycetota bacterium]
MKMESVEFICDQNVAAPGTPAAPRPADRPRPTMADLERWRRASPPLVCAPSDAKPGEAPVKHEANA